MPDLWILAGQSNMQGCGLLNDLETPSPHVRSFAMGDYWTVAEEPLHWLAESLDPVHWPDVPADQRQHAIDEDRRTRTQGAGLGLTFAKTIYEQTGIDIDLVPVAHGGTSMAQWSPSLKSEGGKSLYGALIRQVTAALSSSIESKLRGVLWYQGESDTGLSESKVYLQKTQELIGALRADLDSPDLPFYLVQLGGCSTSNVPGDDSSIGWQTVREAQRLLPTLEHNVELVTAVDLDFDDCIHISTPDLKRLGRRLANIALNRVYGIDTPTGPKLKSVSTEGNRIRVIYSDVWGSLLTPDRSGRVTGFTLDTGDGKPSPALIYKSCIDPLSPTDVLLHFEGDLPTSTALYYGSGIFPFCQLTDSADMAAPAFGPVPIY